MQNHPASVAAALAAGFGAEIDVWAVRDQRLLLRHDEVDTCHELTLPFVSDDEPLSEVLGSPGPLFLHVKGESNGFPERLVDTLRMHGLLAYTYLFCSPSNDAMLARTKATSVIVKTLVTVDDLDGLNVLLDQSEALGGADGVWLEQPIDDWVNMGLIELLHGARKSAWVVSPELHGRKLNLEWLDDWRHADGIVTDYPHLLRRVLDGEDPVVHPKEPWWG